MTPTNIAEQLIRDEGSKNYPYADTNGKLTIGVGRNLSVRGILDSEIEILLKNDIADVTATLHARLPWFQAINPIRQAVFINMAFNLGFNGLENFPRFLMFSAQGNWPSAASEMLNSEWARQVHDRALRLSQQLRTGEWV